ncbi:aminotransferase class IV [Flavobacteriaceae bacterium]|nr:aminotransferase class IV [Flavobacteriaceae bacterium]
MINYNGNLKDHYLNDFTNRAFLYGDSVFETIKVVNNKIMFWEEHYLRLMSSMRILRIKISSIYTPDFFENQIIKTIINLDKSFSGRVRLSVFRDGKGYYMPEINEPIFIIAANKISEKFFKINTGSYKIDLYKDFKVQSDLLSNLKTNNKVLNVIASIYAKDNGLDNCILLNEKKQVAEFINGNIFIVNDNVIKTPPISTGCLNGIMRNKIIELVNGVNDYKIIEQNFSPYELISSNEIWVTNSISGIIAVTEYRKKYFTDRVCKNILKYFNLEISKL